MFTSFDEYEFYEAIEEKNYRSLKVYMVNAILNDPTFRKDEIKEIFHILKDKVPEIFEEQVRLGYEERLGEDKWDKTYFAKLVYWFQDNFSEKRLEYIKRVGIAVYSANNIIRNEEKKESNQSSRKDNRQYRNPKISTNGEKQQKVKVVILLALVLAAIIVGTILFRM